MPNSMRSSSQYGPPKALSALPFSMVWRCFVVKCEDQSHRVELWLLSNQTHRRDHNSLLATPIVVSATTLRSAMVDHHPSDNQVHVIPSDEASSGVTGTTTGKRTRPCLRPKRPTTSLQALHSLHRYGHLTKTFTSSLIERECASLNEELLNLRQNKRQRQGEVTEVRGSGDNKASGSPLVQKVSDAVDVEDLWQRAHRNRRIALLLRDFEVLHHMLVSEVSRIAEKANDEENPFSSA